jgi:hypothetical protein
MSDRDRDIPAADWVDTTAGGEPGGTGRAKGTGSLGAPPTDAPDGDAADSGAGAGGIMESDLGGVDIGGAGKPGAGLGGTRGTGFGSGA